MERSSEVILRNATRLRPGPVLLVNPPRDALFTRLSEHGRNLKAFTQDFGDYRWLQGVGAEAAFGVVPESSTNADTVILNLPREKDRLTLMLHAISSWLPSDAALWLVGENKAGIKSARRHLQRFFGKVGKLDNARHCGLYEATAPRTDEPFEKSTYELAWDFEFSGAQVHIVSLPGVFAHGRLDKGSRLLLKTLEEIRPSGNILDFACGGGVIGCALLAAGMQADLTMLDVSAAAIESSRLSLGRNGLNARLVAADGLTGLDGRYDWIVSNPPFHRGISNDLETAAEFFSRAGTFLTENGRIVIVCNRHLPYTGWLQSHFQEVGILDKNNEFMIIQAVKPRHVKE
jgi:16S rRNA (guanine1207-N2)-methyltransferase